ncbi:MAG: LysM peptidoglycan-binding domain-containing protein [Chitinophagales bacterium]
MELDLQRFATAGPSAGSGRVRRKRSQSASRQPAAVVCPLRRAPSRPRRSGRAAQAKVKPPPAPAPTLLLPARTAKYVVQPGDTLHRIARRFHTTARLLATLNELHKPTLLVTGEILFVPDGGAEESS